MRRRAPPAGCARPKRRRQPSAFRSAGGGIGGGRLSPVPAARGVSASPSQPREFRGRNEDYFYVDRQPPQVAIDL